MNVMYENIPIYAKIAEGIKDRILSGEIPEGEQLPSTTQLSKQHDLNIATVNKAVNVLVNQGIAYKKRGIGMFVCEGAVEKLIEERQKTFMNYYIIGTLKEARRLHYTIEDLQKMVKEAYTQLNGTDPS